MSLHNEYIWALERALAKAPKTVQRTVRFETPKPICSIVGSRTIIHNFKEICEKLRREERKVLKFLVNELATAGTIDSSHAELHGKFSEETISNLIKRFVDIYVYCPVCKQPDTQLEKEKRFLFLVCEACGAKSSVRSF